MILNRDQMLKVTKRTFVTVTVPELDGELRLVSISAGTQVAIQELNTRKSKGDDVTSEMLVLLLHKSIVQEDDSLVFDAPSAKLFFERISMESVNVIIAAIPGFVTKQPVENKPGNSEASTVAG